MKPMIRQSRRENGQAMIEFALTITFLTLLIFSIVEMLGFIYTYSVMANAAKEGVRYAIVHGANNSSPSGPATPVTASSPPCTASNNSTNIAAVSKQTKNFAGFSLHDTSNMTVYVCYLDGNNSVNSVVAVTISYPFRPLFGLGWLSATVNANAAGRIVF